MMHAKINCAATIDRKSAGAYKACSKFYDEGDTCI